MDEDADFETETIDEMTTCTKCDRDLVNGKCSGCGNPPDRCTCETAEVL